MYYKTKERRKEFAMPTHKTDQKMRVVLIDCCQSFIDLLDLYIWCLMNIMSSVAWRRTIMVGENGEGTQAANLMDQHKRDTRPCRPACCGKHTARQRTPGPMILRGWAIANRTGHRTVDIVKS